MEPQDIVADAVIDTLKDRINAAVLKKALTKPVRKELYKKLAEDVVYHLLSEGKLHLPPGFGSVTLKQIKEKDKKIFNKKTGTLETRRVKGNRITYRAGEVVKHLL